MAGFVIFGVEGDLGLLEGGGLVGIYIEAIDVARGGVGGEGVEGLGVAALATKAAGRADAGEGDIAERFAVDREGAD